MNSWLGLGDNEGTVLLEVTRLGNVLETDEKVSGKRSVRLLFVFALLYWKSLL